jgi:hypothetical protein
LIKQFDLESRLQLHRHESIAFFGSIHTLSQIAWRPLVSEKKTRGGFLFKRENERARKLTNKFERRG